MSFTVCVIGLGYVGLPTAALLASASNRVVGVDTNSQLLGELLSGYVRNQEPGLSDLLRSCLDSGQLILSTDIRSSDYYIICVPTPIDANATPDLSYVWSVVDALDGIVSSGQTIIIESTIPVGTTSLVSNHFFDPSFEDPNKLLHFAHCPERVLPGNALHEITTNNRVIGGLTPASTESAAKLYKTFCTSQFTLCDATTAEFSKLAENAYRDVNIAFANELSMMCEAESIAPSQVISIANLHPRVEILTPGIGVGGHCIPVDPLFLINRYPQMTLLMQSARSVNNLKERYSCDKILATFKDSECHEIILYGLTYKADVDDIRESPALRIALTLNAIYPNNTYVIDPLLDDEHIVSLGFKPRPIAEIKRSSLVVVLVRHRLWLATLSDHCSNIGAKLIQLA
jgi:UDP-N-acetyl-D-mannosaminuronic acid dehydrogenase